MFMVSGNVTESAAFTKSPFARSPLFSRSHLSHSIAPSGVTGLLPPSSLFVASPTDVATDWLTVTAPLNVSEVLDWSMPVEHSEPPMSQAFLYSALLKASAAFSHSLTDALVPSEAVKASAVFDISLPFESSVAPAETSLLVASVVWLRQTAVFTRSQSFVPPERSVGTGLSRSGVFSASWTVDDGLALFAGGGSSLGLVLGIGLGVLVVIVLVAALAYIRLRQPTKGNDAESDDLIITSEEKTDIMDLPQEMDMVEGLAPSQTEVVTFSDVLTFCDEPELGDDMSEAQVLIV
jgi:hypothetical protein